MNPLGLLATISAFAAFVSGVWAFRSMPKEHHYSALRGLLFVTLPISFIEWLLYTNWMVFERDRWCEALANRDLMNSYYLVNAAHCLAFVALHAILISLAHRKAVMRA